MLNFVYSICKDKKQNTFTHLLNICILWWLFIFMGRVLTYDRHKKYPSHGCTHVCSLPFYLWGLGRGNGEAALVSVQVMRAEQSTFWRSGFIFFLIPYAGGLFFLDIPRTQPYLNIIHNQQNTKDVPTENLSVVDFLFDFQCIKVETGQACHYSTDLKSWRVGSVPDSATNTFPARAHAIWDTGTPCGRSRSDTSPLLHWHYTDATPRSGALLFSKTGQEGWGLAESGEPALRRGPFPNMSRVLSTEENQDS